MQKTNDFENELKIGINYFTDIISKYKNYDNIEIELRIGQIQYNGFKPGLSNKDFYDKIKSILDKSTAWSHISKTQINETCNNGIRRVDKFNNKKPPKIEYIKKQKHNIKDFQYYGTPYDIRICVATETKTDEKIKLNDGIIRKKNRCSYHYKDYIIDLTIVEQINNGVTNINYELEVELKNLKNNISDKFRAHSALLLMRDLINMCEKIDDECKIIEPIEI
tara:strand:+ start:6346 stop:7011 length:666 start_codon:yes stop_codon:yes gene_type:complete